MSLFKREEWTPLNRNDEPVYGYGSPERTLPEVQDGMLGYWRLLWRRKWTVALVAVLGAGLGVGAAILTKPVYSARTTLEIQDVAPSSNGITLSRGDNQAYIALNDIQTQVRILQSETLAKRTVDKLERSGWPNAPAAISPEFNGKTAGVETRRSLLTAAADSMKVREAGPTRIIELVIDSTDRSLVAEFANAAANEFIDQNMEERWKMSQRTGEWLGRELEDMRSKLQHSESELQSYAQKQGLLFTSSGDTAEGNTNVSGQKLLELQSALSAANSERASKESKFSVASRAAPEGIPDIMNDPALREYRVKISDLRRQLAELSTVYTPDLPRIKRLRGQLESVQAAFDSQRAAVVNKIRNEYDEALMREKLLSADFANQAKTVTLDAEKAIQYNLLKREVDSDRQLYEAMLQRIKESRVNAALKASNIRVVDPASAPVFPSRPNKRMNVAMGLLLGSFVGIGFVVVRDRTDSSFRVPGEAPRWLNVPELGVVPKGGLRLNKQLASSTLSLEPGSSITAIMTSILFSSANGVPPRVLVVTSASPAEGKTTIAANLARKGSETSMNVLLVDADFGRPRLHQIFGLPNSNGFSTLLQKPGMPEATFLSCIREISRGFSVLTSGPALSDASDLLISGHVPDVLARLKQNFQMIVIDTPPTPQFAHARILGRMADAVILVMRSGRTSRDAAVATIHRLTEDGSYVMGTILNDWNPKTSPVNYYWQSGNRNYLRMDSDPPNGRV